MDDALRLKLIVVSDLIAVKDSILGGLSSLLHLLLNLLLHTLSGGSSLLWHAVGLNSLSLTSSLDVCVNLVRAVVADEVGEILNSSRTVVVDWLGLLALLEELDGWEALDLIWDVVESGINLGNDDLVLIVLVETGKLIVLWCESLAVSAPWSVELEENVLVAVDDDVLVVLCNDDLDCALLALLWKWLALDAWLDLAGDEVFDVFANLLCGELLDVAGGLVWELLVLGGVLNGESWPLANFEVEVTSVLAKGRGVDGSEADLALVLFSKWLEILCERFALLSGLGEDVCEWKAGLEDVSVSKALRCTSVVTYSHVSSVCLWANLANQWCCGDLGELGDGLLVELLGELILALIELLVENNGWCLDALGLGQVGIRGSCEEVAVPELLRDLGKCGVGCLVVLPDVCDEHDLVGGLELVEGGLCGEEGDGWQGLLGHVRNNGVCLSCARVWRDVLLAAEDLERWVSLDAVLLAEILLLGAVDLGQCNALLL